MAQRRGPRSLLCYYCNEEGHTKRDCPNKKSSSPASDNRSGSTLVCYNCNQEGHVRRDCPSKDTVVCYNCNEEGHVKRDCPRKSFASDNRSGPTLVCYNCNEEGHIKRDCPNPVKKREYSSNEYRSNDVVCYNCNEEGHIKRDCPKKRDFSGDNRSGSTSVCYNCNKPGHLKRNCPELAADFEEKQYGSRGSPAATKPSGGELSPELGRDDATESSKKSPLPFVDTHCHLEYVFERCEYKGRFSDFAKDRNYPENFEACITSFCDPGAFSSFGLWQELLAEPESKVWASFGVHPHSAQHYYTQGLEEKVLKGMEHERCVAFGEIGLDYGPRSETKPDVQKEVLKHQLKLAVTLGKPIVLHCRDAEDDLFEILKNHVPSEWKLHLHCFTGKLDMALRFLDQFPHLYLGVTGNVTYKKFSNVRSVVQEVPLERLVIETDAPYNTPDNLPRSDKSKFSHPAHAYYVAKEIANLRKMDLSQVLKVVRENTVQLYGI